MGDKKELVGGPGQERREGWRDGVCKVVRLRVGCPGLFPSPSRARSFLPAGELRGLSPPGLQLCESAVATEDSRGGVALRPSCSGIGIVSILAALPSNDPFSHVPDAAERHVP